MIKKYLPLILILLLAAVLRLGALSSFPSGFNADEAALGYNAYSLLLTGRDEHGNIMPVNLESFGDYKPALYSYLLVPWVKFLGLTVFAVRLPSAIFGVLSVFLIYIFVNLIFENSLKIVNCKLKISEIAALILAISPWHLHFSRGAWEVNVSTTLILLGVIFFLRWTNDRKILNFTFSILNFSLSMYAYQSSRILAPALGIGLVILFWKSIFQNIKQSIVVLFLLLFIQLPLLLSLIFTPAASRVGGVGLLADEGPVNFVNEVRGQHSGLNSVLGKFLHNRPVIYSIQFVKNYISHFDGNWLFVNGDEIQRNKVPETGLLYFTDFILLFFGLVFLTNSYKLKAKSLLLLWLLVAPLASALTFQVPHALRAQNMVIPLTILLAGGIFQVLKLSSQYSKTIRITVYCLLSTVYLFQFSRYLHQYYIHYPQTYPAAWQYGFDRLTDHIRENADRYDKVLITDTYDQPYILVLFYLQYDPRQFQENHILTARDKFNFSTVREFDNYVFTDTSWDNVRDDHGSLIIADADDIPEVGVNIVKTINFPNGQPAFKIVSN